MSGPLLAVEIDGAGLDAAVAAEAAGFAFVTIEDSPLPAAEPRIEAGVRAAFLARRTTRIGLAPTLHVTVTEPFHLATQLASLDHASLGRAAWVVGAENSAAALATTGHKPLGDAELRREVSDVIDVARKLWDSWEDDAVIRDVRSGRFLDPDRVHHVNFTGARFSVTGPLITPRPPQGQVVVIGADTLGVTEQLDVALIAAPTPDEVADRARRARAHSVPLTFADLEFSRADDGLPQRISELGDVVDGVRLRPADPATDLPWLFGLIGTTPSLGAAGGPTLRETLGLPRPANQFA